MNLEEYRIYCLSKKGVTEDFPFDENTLVFKVMGKMFALTDSSTFESVNLKSEPEKAADLREQFDFVLPGYHMNKKHWNTVVMDWRLEDRLLRQWTDESYDLVVRSLTKKQRNELRDR